MKNPINFKAVFDSSPHPFILLAADLTVIHANAAALRQSSRRLFDMVGRRIFEVFPGDAVDQRRDTPALLRDVFKRVETTHQSETLPVFRYAVQRSTPDGEVFDERFWTGTLTPIFDRGRLFCVSYNPVEVTEIEMLKRRLRDSDAARSRAQQSDLQAMQAEWVRLQHMFDQAPGFIVYLHGPQHVFEMANQAAYQLLGHRPLIGKPLREALPELEGYGYIALLDQASKSGQPVHRNAMPARLQRYPGAPTTKIYVDLVFQPVVGGDGAVTGVFIQGHEVTEQVRAQQELRAREERWKRALEAAGDAVWDYDLRSGHVMFSDNWKDMLEYRDEMISNHFDDWKKQLHPQDQPRVAAALRESLAEGGPPFSIEYRIRCKSGKWKWILTRGAVMARDRNGKALRMIGTHIDISGKKQSEYEIWRRANFDLLTGLPNRSLFRDRLEHEVEHARRHGMPLALLFIDLDRFKEANDWLGHNAGDLLLQQAAARICHSVRKSDTVARLGGDEFTVIVPELEHVEHVEQIAQKILDELASPFQIHDELVEVSGSIGITLFPADATEPQDLIRHADQAMYVAKNAGRNQFSFFTRSMQESATYRRTLTSELRDAVRERQLVLFLQPIVDLRDGSIRKAEALVRWQHPNKGLMSPTEFISLAEETGLIQEIGDWVFREGASLAQRWSSQLGKSFQVSINRSPAQFTAHAKGIDWTAFLRKQGIAGQNIAVEITEGLLLNASEHVAEQLGSLRDAGIGVAIDDFGTGYSSMAYLKKFDVDYLKIDQSFVRDTDANRSARTIAETIIVMAHKLDLKVIAEGIETEEQRDWLIDAGCDYGQGFLFSRPVPPPEFERLLGARCAIG